MAITATNAMESAIGSRAIGGWSNAVQSIPPGTTAGASDHSYCRAGALSWGLPTAQNPCRKRQPRGGLQAPKCGQMQAYQGFILSKQITMLTKLSSSMKVRYPRSRARGRRAGRGPVTCGFLPIDPWNPSVQVDSQSIASQLFAMSLLPYLGFLYHLTRSKTAPGLTLFGFYFLLVFVGATSEFSSAVESFALCYLLLAAFVCMQQHPSALGMHAITLLLAPQIILVAESSVLNIPLEPRLRDIARSESSLDALS